MKVVTVFPRGSYHFNVGLCSEWVRRLKRKSRRKGRIDEEGGKEKKMRKEENEEKTRMRKEGRGNEYRSKRRWKRTRIRKRRR
jgi:hypothetical protein